MSEKLFGYTNDQAVKINDNCFDIIRLFCTFSVFLGHYITHFHVENDVLYGIAYFVRGVPVFFFLSGLFIARSLEKYNTKEFLKRRVIRIFPELWVCVLINLVIILLSIRGGYTFRDIIIYLLTQFTAFQFYTGDWLRGYGVGTPNGALWTITVDIQFYIVAIFFAKWLKNKQLNIWGMVISLTMILDILLEKVNGIYPSLIYKLLQCNLIPFIWIFLIGMCIYYNRMSLIPFFVKTRWLWLITYILWQYIVPASVSGLFLGIRYNLITSMLMLAMVTGIGFSINIRFKQDYSYSYYLYHMVVINFIINNIFSSFTSPIHFVLCLVITMAMISVLAVLSHRFVAGKLTKKIESKLL